MSDGLQAIDTDSSGTVEAKEFMEFINKHPDMLAREGGEPHLQYSLLAKLYARRVAKVLSVWQWLLLAHRVVWQAVERSGAVGSGEDCSVKLSTSVGDFDTTAQRGGVKVCVVWVVVGAEWVWGARCTLVGATRARCSRSAATAT